MGAVEREAIVDATLVRPGMKLVGLPASGPHSNGYTLVRRLIEGLPLDTDPGGLGQPLGDAVIAPTRIYVAELLTLHARGWLRGAAHITGGGLTGNVPRMLPPGLGAVMQVGSWPRLPIFELLRARGDLTDFEMYQTFNNGLGMVITLAAEHAADVAAELHGFVVGDVVEDAEGQCVVA